MLSPDYLANLPEPMVELFSQLEQDILRDVVRRLIKADFALTGSAAWQVDKLAAIAGSRNAVNRLIAGALKKSDAEIAAIMAEAEAESERAEAGIYAAAGVEYHNTPELTDILKQWIADENRVIRNLTGTIAYQSESVLVSALDRAYMQVVSGAFDYNTAIRQAIHELAGKGLGVLESTGNIKRRESLEAAVRRSVLTGVNRAAGELSLARCEEFGASLVEVSAHIGARPSHAEWQGQVYSLDGKKGKYPDFYSSTGYGTGEGLCGWNCRHSFAPYFEGAPRSYHYRNRVSLEEIGDFFIDIDREESDRIYEAQQEQRRYERAVRAGKKDCALRQAALEAEKAKESPDPALMKQLEADYSKAAVKLGNRRQKLKNYIRSTPESYGLRNDSSRTVVGGFGRSETSKAVWGVRKALTLEAENAKIEKAQKASGVRGKISLHPKKIDLSGFTFDAAHINAREHNVTREEAESYMKNARFSIERWNGEFILFYSAEGAVYINVKDNLIATSFKSNEYDDHLKTLFKELTDEE